MKTGNNGVHDGSSQDGTVLEAFLAIIERGMAEDPESIQPLSSDLLARAERLVGKMRVDLTERID